MKSYPLKRTIAFSVTLATVFMAGGATSLASQPIPVSQSEAVAQSPDQKPSQLSKLWTWAWPKTTRPPKGRRRPGGSLSSATQECSTNTSDALTALTTQESQGFTKSQQPTFWFYVPYAASTLKGGEFSLESKDTTRLYQTQFKFPETPGWVSVQVPKAAGNLLKADQYYRWYFNIYCQDNETTKPNMKVHGWVEPMTRELEPDWYSYDQADQLAQELQAVQPDDQAKAQWSDFLNRLDLGELVSAPIVGPVLNRNSEPVTN